MTSPLISAYGAQIAANDIACDSIACASKALPNIDTAGQIGPGKADVAAAGRGRTGGSGAPSVGEAVLPWYAVYTEPNDEHRVYNGISERGFRAHLVRIVKTQKRYGRTEKVVRPAFPRYVLASFSLADDPWGLILRVRGVRRFLTAPSGKPTALRPGEVERLQAMGRAGDGAIDEDAPGTEPIELNAMVRVLDGPFGNLTGICQWSDTERVSVLLSMFGTQQAVRMPRSSVAAI